MTTYMIYNLQLCRPWKPTEMTNPSLKQTQLFSFHSSDSRWSLSIFVNRLVEVGYTLHLPSIWADDYNS